MDWYGLKEWLEAASGLGKDALHVHAGVMAQIGLAFLLRRSLSSPWPWLAVLLLVAANEYYDLTYEIWPNRGDQYAGSLRDIWNTMLVPTLLMLLVRFAPGLFARPRGGGEPAS